MATGRSDGEKEVTESGRLVQVSNLEFLSV